MSFRKLFSIFLTISFLVSACILSGASADEPFGQGPFGQGAFSQSDFCQRCFDQGCFGQEPFGQGPFGQDPLCDDCRQKCVNPDALAATEMPKEPVDEPMTEDPILDAGGGPEPVLPEGELYA